jgi:hypothetical protein
MYYWIAGRSTERLSVVIVALLAVDSEQKGRVSGIVPEQIRTKHTRLLQ